MRRTALRPSAGTRWPPFVRDHVASHQPHCIGNLAGMPGACAGMPELDHVRASHGIGMKSESIATNAARLCSWHHNLKTRDGRTWRPRLLYIVAALASECASCQQEAIERTGVPLAEVPHG